MSAAPSYAAAGACAPPHTELGQGACSWVGVGLHFPKSFQKSAMAESKKKFLKIYALWDKHQDVQEISLKFPYRYS